MIVPIQAYEKMLKKLEELHDVQLYDEVKKEGDEERIFFWII